MFDISDVFVENRLMVAGPNGGTCLYLSKLIEYSSNHQGYIDTSYQAHESDLCRKRKGFITDESKAYARPRARTRAGDQRREQQTR
jgi:hypothetical protein